jgi:hypothetical protein
MNVLGERGRRLFIVLPVGGRSILRVVHSLESVLRSSSESCFSLLNLLNIAGDRKHINLRGWGGYGR